MDKRNYVFISKIAELGDNLGQTESYYDATLRPDIGKETSDSESVLKLFHDIDNCLKDLLRISIKP